MFNRYPTARYCWYFRQWMRNDFLVFFLLVLGFAIAALYRFFTCTIYQPHTIAELLETFALIVVFFLLAYGTYCVGLRRWVASFKRPEYMVFHDDGISYYFQTEDSEEEGDIPWETIEHVYFARNPRKPGNVMYMRIVSKAGDETEVNMEEVCGDHVEFSYLLTVPILLLLIMGGVIFVIVVGILAFHFLGLPQGMKASNEIKAALRYYEVDYSDTLG